MWVPLRHMERATGVSPVNTRICAATIGARRGRFRRQLAVQLHDFQVISRRGLSFTSSPLSRVNGAHARAGCASFLAVENVCAQPPPDAIVSLGHSLRRLRTVNYMRCVGTSLAVFAYDVSFNGAFLLRPRTSYLAAGVFKHLGMCWSAPGFSSRVNAPHFKTTRSE